MEYIFNYKNLILKVNILDCERFSYTIYTLENNQEICYGSGCKYRFPVNGYRKIDSYLVRADEETLKKINLDPKILTPSSIRAFLLSKRKLKEYNV